VRELARFSAGALAHPAQGPRARASNFIDAAVADE